VTIPSPGPGEHRLKVNDRAAQQRSRICKPKHSDEPGGHAILQAWADEDDVFVQPYGRAVRILLRADMSILERVQR